MINIHISEWNYDTWTYCSARYNVNSEQIRLAFSGKKNLNLSHVSPLPIMVSRRWYGLFSTKSRLMI